MQALIYPHGVASPVDRSVVYVVEISPNIILKMSSKRQVDRLVFVYYSKKLCQNHKKTHSVIHFYGLCSVVYFDVFGKF